MLITSECERFSCLALGAGAAAEDEATEGIAARFTGALEVIGGTNAYARATGIGTMTGTRAAAIGSPVKLVFRLHVRK